MAKRMTVTEAYELTLEKIEELRSEGIKVKIKPTRSRNDKETVEKFSGPDHLPPDKWVTVNFDNLDKGKAYRVLGEANYLGMVGIQFDSGGMPGTRDWELDWSFRYTGEEDTDRRDAMEAIEEEISNLDEEGHSTL